MRGLGRADGGEDFWQSIPVNGTQTLERAGHTASVVGRHIYIVGGRNKDDFYKDLLRFDTHLQRWDTGFGPVPFAQGRAYHAATVLGSKIWLTGGSSANEVFSDILVFDTLTLAWERVTLRKGKELVHRTCHACQPHPTKKHCLLIFCGYNEKSDFLNDVVLLDTTRLEATRVKAGGAPPQSRGYFDACSVGTCCYIVGGRTSKSVLIKDGQFVACFDAASSRWVPMTGVRGAPPCARSSHRVVSFGQHVLMFGGAGEGKPVPRHNDLHALDLTNRERPEWRELTSLICCTTSTMPAVRAAHGMAIVQDELYVMGGYGKGRDYAGDAWKLRVSSLLCGVPTSQAARTSRAQQAEMMEASQWQSTKRRKGNHHAAPCLNQEPDSLAGETAAVDAEAPPQQCRARANPTPAAASIPVPVLACTGQIETAVVEMEHLKRENTDLRTELEVHKAMLNQAQDHRQLLQKMATLEGTALQQQRHSEHLAEQLKQQEVELKAKQLELAQQVLGRKLAESQQAQAENAARQEALKAQQALEDYRSRAQVELVQARQNLVTVTAECDALGQKADQQASDLASGNSIIKDLQSDVHRASTNEKEAEQRAAQVTAQLLDARKVWDAERATLQGRLAEAEEQRSALTAREAQACSRASTLQLQLQAVESAREVTSGQLRELQERHNNLQQDVRRAKNDLAAAQEELKGLKAYRDRMMRWMEQCPATDMLGTSYR